MNSVRYPQLPEKMAQSVILLLFPVIFNFCWKTSATKFLCVKTSSSKVVAILFLYLGVHRWIAGDIPVYQNFVLKVAHPFRKRWFRQISLNSAAAMRASEKNSISTYRKSTTCFPMSHRWTVYVTPMSPNVWLKMRIYICHCPSFLHYR